MCIVLSAQIVVTAFTTKYGKEINPHPWPQLLMETGAGNNTGKSKDCQKDRHPHLQGGDRTENRECDIKSTVGKEIESLVYKMERQKRKT
jgi:hypothetical protein